MRSNETATLWYGHRIHDNSLEVEMPLFYLNKADMALSEICWKNQHRMRYITFYLQKEDIGQYRSPASTPKTPMIPETSD